MCIMGYALHLSNLNVILMNMKLEYDLSKKVILDIQIVMERWILEKFKTSKTRK